MTCLVHIQEGSRGTGGHSLAPLLSGSLSEDGGEEVGWGGEFKQKIDSCQPAEEERKECGEVCSEDWRRAELYLVRPK